MPWVIAIGIASLVLACGETDSRDQTQPLATTTAAAQPTQPAPATSDDTPIPRRVTFALGETINTAGQAGVVFVDPTTTAAEGWLLPGVPANYSFSVAAADGHLLWYRCQHPNGSPYVIGCDGSTAWYRFDTRDGSRLRFDMFIDYPPPFVIWPEGDEVLGTTAGGAALVSAEQPDTSRPMNIPAGYQLFTPSALWDRDGTHLIVSVFHTGTPQCGYGSGSNPPRVCGGPPFTWQTLLLDRSNGRVIQIDEKRSTFSWSPDGSTFAIARDGGNGIAHPSEIAIYSRDGNLLWSKPRYGASNPSWSPDGSLIAIQVLSKPELVASAMRLEVLDAATGETRYRIAGAIGCQGRLWTADSARLILPGAFGFAGSVVADPRDGTLRALGTYSGSPSPLQPDVAYLGFSWWTTAVRTVNIDNGDATSLLTFSSPMEPRDLSESLLFGSRFAFVATTAGGRGGCAEAIENDAPPTTHIEFPPFAN
jgi:hypothetical protein